MGSLWSATVLEAAAFAVVAAGVISLALAWWTRGGSGSADPLPGAGWALGGRRPLGALDALLRRASRDDPARRTGPAAADEAQGAQGPPSAAGSRAPPDEGPGPSAVFLFEGGRLVDASPAARRLLRGVDRRAGDLRAVTALLARRFGADLPDRVASLADGERISLPAQGPSGGGEGAVEAEMDDGALRLLLRLDDPEGAMERLALEAAQAELAQLRALAEDAPGPIWALDAAGRPVWANLAYLQLADLAQGLKGSQASRAAYSGERPDPRLPNPRPPDPRPPDHRPPDHRPPERPPSAWPARPLFEPPAGLVEGQAETRRMSLQLPGKAEPEWFDVTSVRRGAGPEAGSVHFATDVGRLVGAETSRSSFVQTLTKAFAHLTVGLAVFDKQRRLTLFNPAFADLTGLSFGFLSGRPLVHAVLDRLREAQVLPEPRNYASWRDGMAALEAAASAGTYCETWTLPDGRTYRVTGRPHPDGALAFLVEDITDEIALARRVHAELDTARAVLDSLGEGVAVFTAAGTLSLSNAAYDALWREAGPPEARAEPAPVARGSGSDLVGLTDPSLWGELDRWERAFGPSRLWDDLRAGRVRSKGGGTAEVGGAGAPALVARATPLPGGGLVVGFAHRDARDARPPEGPRGEGPDGRSEVTPLADPAPGRSRAAL